MTFVITQIEARRLILQDLDRYLKQEVQLRWEPRVTFDLGGDNGDRVIGVRIADLQYTIPDCVWREETMPWGLALCTAIDRLTIDLMDVEPEGRSTVLHAIRIVLRQALDATLTERQVRKLRGSATVAPGPESQTPTLDFSEVVSVARGLASDDEDSDYNRALADVLTRLIELYVGARDVAETLLEGEL